MSDLSNFAGIAGMGNQGVFSTRRTAASESAEGFLAAFVQATSAAEEPKDKTLEEFKKEFYAWIDTVPIHPSQAGAAHSVSIHDKAFEKMMNDPEYKAEVEALITREFGAAFAVTPAFTTMRFDAEGVYTGTAGGSAHWGSYNRESSDAFWTSSGSGKSEAQERAEARRTKRKKLDELMSELAADRRQRNKDAAQDYYHRFTRNEANGLPYMKSDIFISPPLDILSMLG